MFVCVRVCLRVLLSVFLRVYVSLCLELVVCPAAMSVCVCLRLSEIGLCIWNHRQPVEPGRTDPQETAVYDGSNGEVGTRWTRRTGRLRYDVLLFYLNIHYFYGGPVRTICLIYV